MTDAALPSISPIPSRVSAKGRARVGKTALGLGGLAIFLLLWEAAPGFGLISPLLLPPPSSLPGAFWRDLQSGAWYEAIFNSLSHYLLGLALGSGLGVGLGVWAGVSPRFESATSYIVRVLRPIPGLAWVPFAIIWFGVSTGGATFIVAVGVFWINFYAAIAAVQAVDRDLIEVAEAFGHRSIRAKLAKIILPAAAPGILGGLRTGLGQAWMAVVAAELFGVPGLGQRMMQASSLLATEIVVVYMLTIAALYGLCDYLFVLWRDTLLKWKP
ncbi:MAG: ABC transporter permease subunit [Alphaproteobacteria bacterium]|nr:ABC transporter permease subunit [Alphaproteobacteria bacterium]